MLGLQVSLYKFTLDVITSTPPESINGGCIIGTAKSKEDEDPSPAKVETRHKMRCNNSLRTIWLGKLKLGVR